MKSMDSLPIARGPDTQDRQTAQVWFTSKRIPFVINVRQTRQNDGRHHGLVYGEQHQGLPSCVVWQRRIYANLVLSFERTVRRVRVGALEVRRRNGGVASGKSDSCVGCDRQRSLTRDERWQRCTNDKRSFVQRLAVACRSGRATLKSGSKDTTKVGATFEL